MFHPQSALVFYCKGISIAIPAFEIIAYFFSFEQVRVQFFCGFALLSTIRFLATFLNYLHGFHIFL